MNAYSKVPLERHLKVRSLWLNNRKVAVEIKKIETETQLLHRRYRLEIAKVVIAVGGLSATIVTVLQAIFGA